MPKRPKQHQLEDMSRAKFQLCLPDEWVIRYKDKDYGIDCEIELFDESENSTGLLFYAQLKATSSNKDSEIFNVDLKIDTLEYFKQLEIPVLLVRYSQHSQIRNREEADKIAGKGSTITGFESALEKDLLSSLAWFNLGISMRDNSEFEEATFCFAMCACISLWDIEAWTFAFLAFLNSGKNGNLLIGSLILKTAYYHNRDEFLMHLYGIIEQNGGQNTDVIKMIDKILTKDNYNREKSATLRILDGEDFKEIEVK